MRFLRSWLLCAVALLIVAAAATAQTTNGTVTGHVADAQGLALPGVTVNASSPSLQGVRAVVTSENGDYVLTGLPSGTYTISFDLSGFESVKKTVALAPTQMLPLDVQLGVAAFSEAVTVTGRTADVLTQTAQVATNFKQDLIQTLPTNRDINATLLQAPGVHPTGPSGAFTIAGATSFESLFMVNGVALADNIRGTPYDLYVEDAIQETTVAIAGVSAEFGRFGGGMVNVITKSGGNQFGGSFRETLNDDNWRTLTPFETSALAANPLQADPRLAKVVPEHQYYISGPVMQNKLWFFTAGRIQSQESNRTLLQTNILYPYTDESQRYEGKVTYSATAKHRFQGDYLKIIQTQKNYTFNPAISMDTRSLGDRKLPETLATFNYNGVLSDNFYVEGRYSGRRFSFVDNGAKSTDLIQGTLLINQANSGRYWSDTFCGVCGDTLRNNDDYYFKGSYFLSKKGSGSHNVSFGYDTFNDITNANNHQSGSDYRILGSSAYVLPSGDVVPQFLGNNTTIIQYNPLPTLSQGSNFRTHSVFATDAWRVNSHVTANLGLRWDKNHGLDQAGTLTANDSGWSPRLGIVWDPNGKGEWAVTGSFAKYIAAISNPIADSTSAAGNPQTYSWFYQGPNINTVAPTTGTADAIQQVFTWFNANGGASRTLRANPTIPGLTPRIDGSLASPYNLEYAGGVSRQFGSKAAIRADVSYRNFKDAYVTRIDQSTGKVVNSFGQSFDLALVQNDTSGSLSRQYTGVTLSGTYRFAPRVDFGGNYTLSHTWGNFEGENQNSGPTTSAAYSYPEYKQASWNYPVGDLQIDQRHRSRMWLNYGVPKLEGMTLSFLQTLESGIPYGATNLNGASANGVNPRPFVTIPGFAYSNPPDGAGTTYFFTARDAFRTEGQIRTDLAVNYTHKLSGTRAEVFGQLSVLNIFNQFQLCGCGGSVFQNGGAVTQTRIDMTVRTAVSNPTLYSTFNPFTTTPVKGVNWDYGPNFGKPTSRLAYTSPRELRLSFGVRF
jgi:hypothetical protein